MGEEALESRVEKIISLMPKIMNSMSMSKMHRGSNSNLNLTFNQYQALIAVFESKRCSVNDLAQKLRIAQSTTSQLVDRLVRSGLVIREIHDMDRRRMDVFLSPEGESMMEQRKNQMRDSFRAILVLLSEQDQERFVDAYSAFFEIGQKVEQRIREEGMAK